MRVALVEEDEVDSLADESVVRVRVRARARVRVRVRVRYQLFLGW